MAVFFVQIRANCLNFMFVSVPSVFCNLSFRGDSRIPNKCIAMKNELLKKLEELLEAENPLDVQKEFNAAKTRLKSLMERPVISDDKESPMHTEDKNKDAEKGIGENSSAETPEVPGEKMPETNTATDRSEGNASPAAINSENDAPTSEESATAAASASEIEPAEAPAADGESQKSTVSVEAEASDAAEQKVQTESDTANAALASGPENRNTAGKRAGDNDAPSPVQESEADENSDELLAKKFTEITKAFKAKVSAARDEMKRIEEETVATAKNLMEELKSIVENEENIGKAFSGFNAIQEKWKSLPKVSNDNYRDLNAEYNKLIERFFYNINIYKELKELDLKKNLEEKQKVLTAQKSLAESDDIRLLEVEVRMNQDRWNEIGPTYKEEWDKIKDEFWDVTRSVYKRIQDFYNARKEEQERNLDAKKALLEKAREIEALELKAHKKWQEKTKEIIALQNEWKLIGFVPKDKGKKVWKAFREVCDSFFDKKRAHYAEIRAEQDANKNVKESLLKEAESLKDSENWKETADRLIHLQKKWKETGPAHQRDENKLWRQFRAACDHFFQARNDQRAENKEEEKENLKRKEEIIEALEKFEPDPADKEAVEKLKSFSEQWRNVGHVPFKAKDKVNKAYKDLMDQKFAVLKIDRREKEKIRFEEKVGLLKSSDAKDKLVRKEQDIIRGKISKIESEINQYENNLGFFAQSKGAEKLKEQVLQKIEKAKQDVDALYAQLDVLDEVKE